MQPIKLQLTSIRHWWKSIQLLILAVLLALSLLGVAIAQDSFHREPIQVTAAIPRNFPPPNISWMKRASQLDLPLT